MCVCARARVCVCMCVIVACIQELLGRAPLHQVNNAYWADATLARMVLDSRVGRIASLLAGVNGVRLWHDQLLYKPPLADVHPEAEALLPPPGAEERPRNGAVSFHQANLNKHARAPFLPFGLSRPPQQSRAVATVSISPSGLLL